MIVIPVERARYEETLMERGRVLPTVGEREESTVPSLMRATSVEVSDASMNETLGRALASLSTIFSLHIPVHLLSLSSKYGL